MTSDGSFQITTEEFSNENNTSSNSLSGMTPTAKTTPTKKEKRIL